MQNLNLLFQLFLTLISVGGGGVQQPEFPEGDFLSKEGDFCRSRELRQLQNTHHHAIILHILSVIRLNSIWFGAIRQQAITWFSDDPD